MAEKNQFNPWPSEWDGQQWQDYLGMNLWAHKEQNELPPFILKNGLSKKFNSALICASGSSTHNFYGVVGYRPDGTSMDEHAFVYIEDRATGHMTGGIIQHASYDGRTTPIPSDILAALGASGVTASIQTNRMPTRGSSGSLADLQNMNLLSGVSENFGIMYSATIVPGMNGPTGSTMP